MASRKMRYNWKARQTNTTKKTTRHKDQKRMEHMNTANVDDTNYFTIIPLPTNTGIESGEKRDHFKHHKMSSRQKKKLLKILETKERKAKHSALIEKLQSMSLPQTEMNLLHTSTSVTRKKPTRKEVLERAKISMSNEVLCNTISCIRKGRKRNRKKLTVEKILASPKITDNEKQETSEESEQDDIREEGEEIGEEGEKIGEEGEEIREELKDDKEEIIRGETIKDRHTGEEYNVMDRHPVKKHDVISVSSDKKGSIYVPVSRSNAIQISRLALPILSEEYAIMDAIQQHNVVIVCGETGSGKTTQVPQFLYEAGYAHKNSHQKIGITEPRRVAAISVSQRVSHEMNLSNREVSYQIRYEGNVTDNTLIKFMTDGVLLKEIEQDFLLSHYSVIVIDEAHERSVFADILIGLLSRIILQRYKNGNTLKLIIMSATLRVEDFTSNQILFPIPPPVIKVESRQYPVTVHFNRYTPNDYVMSAYRKVCKIHRDLPFGHILVFLTGKFEIYTLCNKLRKTFSNSSLVEKMEEEKKEVKSDNDDVSHWIKDSKRKKKYAVRKEVKKRWQKGQSQFNNINLNDYPAVPLLTDNINRDDDEEELDDDILEIDSDEELLIEDNDTPLLVLPLYSMLSPDKQYKVFQAPPSGVRLCVVATNVAETSITIPHVKYVVDSGKVKRKHYDKLTGISKFKISWISKSSANQRAGRAGRTEPGHCYRLYSSSIYHHEFPDHTPPEITLRPVDDLVLQMKAMNIHKVVNFPFPTSPDLVTLKTAESMLVRIGALETQDSTGETPHITNLGLTMSQFPISPRYSKMLCLSHQYGCLPYMVTIVSALSVPEMFINSWNANEQETHQVERITSVRRAWTGQGECYLLGDLMVLLRAVGAYEYTNEGMTFCEHNGLRYKAMCEIRKLRQQLTNIINTVCYDINLCLDPQLPPPTQQQSRLLRQLVLTGFGDHVAKKINTDNMNAQDKKKLRCAYQTPLCDSPVFIHSSSVLCSLCPKYVVFQEIIETNKLYMREITAVDEEWFPLLLPQMCSFSSPLDTPPPVYDPVLDIVKCYMTCTFGPWTIPPQELSFPDSLEKYKYFAKFLLDGEVFSGLSQFVGCLFSPPITMVKPWAKLQHRTQVLLSALVAKQVFSKASLLAVWKDDPKYLLSAYSMWLPQSVHRVLGEMWPPIEH